MLFDINLEIFPSEIAIITGPSGSGKTTLLTLIGGLRTVKNGSIRFLDQQLKGESQQRLVKVHRQIGYEWPFCWLLTTTAYLDIADRIIEMEDGRLAAGSRAAAKAAIDRLSIEK